MTKATIEHVIVLMLENRSFDHMLGLYPNRQINGLFGPDGLSINPAYKNVVTGTGSGQGETISVQAGATYTIDPLQIDKRGFGGPGHSFPDATMQLYNTAVAPASTGIPAPLSGFAQSYFNQLRGDVGIQTPTDAQLAVPLCAFTQGQLPTLWQLTQEFCVCDNWFSEVPGPTQPNRLFTHCGTSSGFTHNVWDQPFENQTIYEALDKAGRDWSVFYFDLRDTDSFPQIKKRIDRVLPFQTFLSKAQAGQLPTYSFLCPRYNEPTQATDPPPNSEHAPYDVRNGENLIADVYEALRAGPGWPQSLLIITYDEHGGYFDHVPPATSNVDNPDGLTSPTSLDRQQAKANPTKNGYLLKPNNVFDFRRLGLRVPALLVSPWVAAGSVVKSALQHTSIFATLRDLYGVGTLTKRDAQAASFASALSLAAPRTDAPTLLNRPPVTPSDTTSGSAPLTQQQSEMWPLLSQLDGHADSGKVAPEPATGREAAQYIHERIAAHERFHRERRRTAAYIIVEERSGTFSWILRDERGVPIAASPRQYQNQSEAESDIARIRDVGPFARQLNSSLQQRQRTLKHKGQEGKLRIRRAGKRGHRS
jgi:phospholipase C